MINIAIEATKSDLEYLKHIFLEILISFTLVLSLHTLQGVINPYLGKENIAFYLAIVGILAIEELFFHFVDGRGEINAV